MTIPHFSRSVTVAVASGLAVILTAFAALSLLGGNEPASAEPPTLIAQDPPASEPKVSKRRQFIRDADQICADIMTQLQELPTPTNLEEGVKVLEMARDIAVAARQRALKLDVPHDAKRGWDSMMGSDADYAEIDRVIAAVKNGDIAALNSYDVQHKERDARDRKWAKRYGMAVCSRELS